LTNQPFPKARAGVTFATMALNANTTKNANADPVPAPEELGTLARLDTRWLVGLCSLPDPTGDDEFAHCVVIVDAKTRAVTSAPASL